MNNILNAGSVLVGIGIASGSRQRLTVGTPFDLVPFLIAAEDFRVSNNFDNGIILIAENPAMYSFIASIEEVKIAGDRLVTSVQCILERFALNRWKIIRESSFAMDAEYLALADSLHSIAADYYPDARPEVLAYFAGQTADVEFIRRRFNVQSKFGWASDKTTGERAFDLFYTFAIDRLARANERVLQGSNN